ncbi:MAG: hypothetical protein N4A35_03205 [Flavobacteriales bacterium]|jgi:hypothetical protein|nr:hypothetical protein [Flavobacteriales bacterium]
MKRLFILGFSAALLAGGVSSCAKTSKGKMANEWTVSEMNMESTSTDSDGDKTVTTMSISGTTGTMENTYTVSGTSTKSEQSAAVTELTYTIEKDGSWSSVSNIAWTRAFTGGQTVTSTETKTSGTWSFLSKNKSGDFKKNERVIFNTLSEKTSEKVSTTIAGATTNSESSDDDTYAEGENTMVFVVVESKGKELKLKADINNSYTNTSGGVTSTDTEVGTQSMTLVQK